MKFVIAVCVLVALADEPALAAEATVNLKFLSVCKDSLVLVALPPTRNARITLRQVTGSGYLMADCQDVAFSPGEIDSISKLWNGSPNELIRYRKLVWYLTHQAFWYSPGTRPYIL